MKKLFIILVPLIIAGAVFGLAFTGIINIHGITPAKKSIKSTKKSSKAASKAGNPKNSPAASQSLATNTQSQKTIPTSSNVTTQPIVPPSKSLSPPEDMDSGAKKVASIWGNMDPTSIVKVMGAYKPKQVALILSKMDNSEVAKIFELLPPKQAAQLSQEIQKQVAIATAKQESNSPTG